MGLLDGIERLITEHGAAAILKERIELANDKYALLEARLAQSEARERQLSIGKENIEREYSELQTKVRNLERQLAVRNGEQLDPLREKLLVCRSLAASYLMRSAFSSLHLPLRVGARKPLVKTANSDP